MAPPRSQDTQLPMIHPGRGRAGKHRVGGQGTHLIGEIGLDLVVQLPAEVGRERAGQEGVLGDPRQVGSGPWRGAFYSLGPGALLGEETQHEVPLLVGLESGGHHHVLPGRQAEARADLTQVDELLRARPRRVSQEEVPLQVHGRLAHQLVGDKEGAGAAAGRSAPPSGAAQRPRPRAPSPRPGAGELPTAVTRRPRHPDKSCHLSFLMGQVKATTLPTARGGGEETLWRWMDGGARTPLKSRRHHPAQGTFHGAPRLKLTTAL